MEASLRSSFVSFIKSVLKARTISLLCLFFVVLLDSCSDKGKCEIMLFEETELNTPELLNTLSYFKKKKDLEGYSCASFLIKNMLGSYSISNTGEKAIDTKNIKSKYLIDNIENALCMRHSSNSKLSSHDFYEYVLPYRIVNEPLIDWREHNIKKYISLSSSNLFTTVKSINDSLKSGFKFSYEVKPAQQRDWIDLYNNKIGDCWAMNLLTLYPLRALGLPVTIDFVTNWCNVNGGSHAWSVIVNGNKTSPFMGCETSPPHYNPFIIYRQKRLPAKVFRINYSINRESLPENEKVLSNIPSHLNFNKYIDVTDLYFPVSDVKLPFNNIKTNILFLSVFSNGSWKPVTWGNKSGNSFLFKKMTHNSIYMPTEYRNNVNKSVYWPFLIKDKKQLFFKPDHSRLINVCVKTLQSKTLDELAAFSHGLSGEHFYKHMDDIDNGTYISEPVKGKKYNLFYWNNGWLYHSTTYKKKGKPLVFKDVPSNCVYRISEKQFLTKERIFTYGDSQQWW